MKIIPLLIFFLITMPVSANFEATDLPKNGTITGTIIDTQTKTPIPYATVVIIDKSTNFSSGEITDENGKFEIDDVPEGSYTFEAQFIGYEVFQKEIEITPTRFKIDLGTIQLSEISMNLQEVVVRAETSTVVQKIDRKVITIGKDLTSVGATAAEIMNNIQSVSVDQDGNISLRGNSNVRVLVDGRPTNISAAQLLQQLPSSSIKSIELITNPSAKYDPEGMSGIINIILNKNANLGFNGTITSGLTFGENIRFNGSLDLNYRAGKFNFFVNYGANSGKNESYGEIERFDTNSFQDFTTDNDDTSHLIKTGLDFYINEKNTFSFYMVQNLYDGETLSSTEVTYPDGNFNNIFQIYESDKENNTYTYNFNYKLEFEKEGHNVELEANFSDTDSPENAIFKELNNPANPTLNYGEDLNNATANSTINLDYTNPLSEKTKLELGLESRIQNLDNTRITTQEEIIIDEDGNVIGTSPLSDVFYEYDREIYSAYANFNHEFEKLTVQIGARLEDYQAEASLDKIEIFKDDYITLYPSAFLTYNSTDKNQYQLSYSRRVDRPSFGQVNPIREWSTPQITSVGNPELNPQFTNSLEINYTRKVKNGSFTFGAFYRIINDNISRIVLIDPLDPNKSILTFTNTDNTNAYGIELSTNYKFTKWWDINASFDLYNQTEKGLVGLEEIEVENTASNFRVNNNFKATKDLRFQLFGMYRGSNQNLQFKTKPMWKMDLGASYNLFEGKGTLSARYSDIFNSMFWGFDSDKPYPSTGQFNWESQTAYIGFSYRFGSNEAKSRARKNRNDNEKQGGGFL